MERARHSCLVRSRACGPTRPRTDRTVRRRGRTDVSLSDFWLFLQQGVLSGLVTGSVYALLALAIVIVFKTTDVPNFSQGELFMAGAYVALMLVIVAGWPQYAVIPATLGAIAIVAAVFQ